MCLKMCIKCFVLVLCCDKLFAQRFDLRPGLHEMPGSLDALLPPSEPWPDFKEDPGPPLPPAPGPPEPPGLPLPPDRYPVRHAGLPHKLEVFPLPLKDSDHELKFNVSWIPSIRRPAKDYSLEVRSITDTVDCQSPMCYEYNIPGEATWWMIPAFSNPVAEMCAVRPGCAYMVRLIAHPWDGHTSANLHVELDECVAGVCSCAHSPRLPAPEVTAETVTIQGEMFTNVSWTLPKPTYPQRLPSAKLGKHSYVVSLGKQMVSDAHPAPWFANTITREVDADGYVSEGDTARWLLLPVSERSVERSGDRSGDQSSNSVVGPNSAQSVKSANGVKVLIPEVKLLARVNLIDDRGCVGPAGNATAFDPSAKTTSKFSFGTYVVLAALAGAWLMGAVFALSARIVKRVLKTFRPAPVSAPLEPLNRRPAWFPLQLRGLLLAKLGPPCNVSRVWSVRGNALQFFMHKCKHA
ncbi:unnamed protein product [Chrysodeixis includens]|uniref:Uncharacterized protein n=1 Tax=Chrysodeixis includens TaxID=689277 RepID=A0A9N8KTI2_CHRIL|nr:unnamed protein product [Chrysodeixis includens]